jgi:hypothetical protein
MEQDEMRAPLTEPTTTAGNGRSAAQAAADALARAHVPPGMTVVTAPVEGTGRADGGRRRGGREGAARRRPDRGAATRCATR